jgi:hypothetical protein
MRRTNTRAASLVITAGVLALWLPAKAEDNSSKTPVLLELFTSEGCSSCPPADRLLESLDEKQPFSSADLVVLSEHVDYWNGEGWSDPYSSRFFSERQSAYAEQFGLDSVYTPQVVIDGHRQAVGGNAVDIRNAVEASARERKVALTIAGAVREGAQIRFHLASADLPATEGRVTVYIALAENKVQSHVGGGENGGRSLSHVAVVRALVPAGTVKGGSSFSKDVTVAVPSATGASGFRIVAFLQDDKSHKVVAAAYEKVGHQNVIREQN